jgi:hypothetical protein
MTAGQELTVVEDGEVEVRRALVAFENGLFFVCRPEEWESAKREGRDPVCIGFKPEYVLTTNSDTLRP